MGLWLLSEETRSFEESKKLLSSKRKVYIDKGFQDFLDYLREVYKDDGDEIN